MSNCCNDNIDPCIPANVGCLSQTKFECVFLTDQALADILDGVVIGDNLNDVLLALTVYINELVASYEYEPTGLGDLCILGGEPFDFNTWLQNLEIYTCGLNPVTDIALDGNTITFTFLDASTTEIELPTLIKIDNTIFVDSEYGDDGTGERERRNYPFLTVNGAIAVAEEGDVIHIINGYNVDDKGYLLDVQLLFDGGLSEYTFYLEPTVEFGLAAFTATPIDLGGTKINIYGEHSESLTFTADNQYHNYTLDVRNIKNVDTQELRLWDNVSSYWQNIDSLYISQTELIESSAVIGIPQSQDAVHKFVDCNIGGSSNFVANIAGNNTEFKRFSITFESCNITCGLITSDNTFETNFEVFLNLLDCEVKAESVFTDRYKGSEDYFKNTTIEATADPAYRLSANHIGDITMINVRLIGTEELEILQTIPATVNAKLQNVWSNQYPTNAMTPAIPAIERLHLDGEDEVKTITFANHPYTMGKESTLIVDSTGGDITITFPKANRISKEITLIGAGGVNTMTLTAFAGETLNGSATKIKATPANEVTKIKSDRFNLYGWATMSF